MTSAPIAGYNTQLYITSTPSVTLTDAAMTDSGDHMTFNITTSSHQCLDKSATTTIQAEYDDVQTITITGAPTGGTFTLTFNGHTTGTIAFNAAASAVQTALIALTGVGSGQVLVSGSAGGPYTVDWTGTLAYASQTLMTASGAGLTGGTSPGVTIAHTQVGQAFTTVAPTINYPIGQVVFAAPLLGTTPVVRIHAGKYFPFSFLTYANTADQTISGTALDVTSFTNPVSPWKQFISGVNGATVKIGKFFATDFLFLTKMSNGDLVIIQIYPGQNANQRYQGYGVISSDAIKSAVNAVNTEDVNFTIDGQLFFIAS